MTTVAAAPGRAVAPPRRRTSASSGANARAGARPDARPVAKPDLRVAPAHPRTGRVGTLVALFTVFALVTAVVGHVVLAQNQLELDRLNDQIAKEQVVYEQKRLTTSQLASPERVIAEAERLGLVLPAEPATYLYVPDAPTPTADGGEDVGTLNDWTKAKRSLGDQQP